MSKFSDKIKFAFSNNLTELIRKAFLLNQSDFINQSWKIDLQFNVNRFDIEMLEKAVRLMAEFYYHETGDEEFEIFVAGCPEELKEYLNWFIKFFALLELSELNKRHSKWQLQQPSKEIEDIFTSHFVQYPFDLEDLDFITDKIIVTFE